MEIAFPVPLWLSINEDTLLRDHAVKMAYNFRNSGARAGLVSEKWGYGETTDDVDLFDQYGLTSFTSTNLAGQTDSDWMDVEHAIVDHAQYLIPDLRPKIANMWLTIYPQGGYVPTHTHPGSVLSGVYYAKAEPNCGNLEFQDPSWALKQSIQFSNEKTPDCLKLSNYVVQPTSGLLVLFPSYLPHFTQPNQSGEDRIIYSFNIVPS